MKRMFTTSRIRQLRASRLVAAIFALGLLGFSVAPCQAMPHQQHLGTSHHGSMPAGDCGHCPHAPSGLGNGCAIAATADCAMAGPALPGYRVADLPQPAAAPPPAIGGIAAFIPDARPMRDARVRQQPVPHASIQQRYCSFLN